MKKIIALALVLCLMMTLLCGCQTVSRSPVKALERATKMMADDISDNRAAEVLENSLDGGSVEFSMNLTDILSLVANTELSSKIGISMKTYSEKKGTVSAAVLSLLVDDKSMAEASAYIDEDKFVFESEELLGSSAYGATMESLREYLKENVPGFDDEMLQNPADAANTAEIAAILIKYIKIYMEEILKACPAERVTDKITIGDETVSATIFNCHLTSKDTVKVTRSVFEKYKKDTHSRKVVDKFIEDYDLNPYGTDFCDELEENISSAEAEAENSSEYIDVSFVFNSKAGNLMKASLELDTGVKMDVIFGVDRKNPKYSALIIEADYEHLVAEIKLVEDTKETSKREINVSETTPYSEFSVTAVLDYNKSSGEYKLSSTLPSSVTGYGNATVAVNGVYKATNKSLICSIDTVSAKMGTMLSFNLDISAKMTVLANDGHMPKAPKDFKDITNEDVQEEVEDAFEANAEQFISLLPEELFWMFY